jgi:hypothetical protein
MSRYPAFPRWRRRVAEGEGAHLDSDRRQKMSFPDEMPAIREHQGRCV